MGSPQIFAKLNNGIEMPLIGFGTYDLYGRDAEKAVTEALEIGYRLIDTAAMYNNEFEVGNAILKSGIPRKEIFVTTKLNNSNHGYDSTLKAYEESKRRLQLDYVDLYLVHWPIRGKRKDSWRAFEKLFADKQLRAIGVANYLLPFLEELKSHAAVMPAVNQVELSPYLHDADFVNYCKVHQMQLQSYTPLVRGKKFKDPRLIKLSEKYQRSPAQVILRWNVQQGYCPIPKASSIERIRENFQIFDFELSREDIAWMNSFNENFRVCENPMDFL